MFSPVSTTNFIFVSAAATQISSNARAVFRKHTETELNAIVDVIESSIAGKSLGTETDDGSAVYIFIRKEAI